MQHLDFTLLSTSEKWRNVTCCHWWPLLPLNPTVQKQTNKKQAVYFSREHISQRAGVFINSWQQATHGRPCQKGTAWAHYGGETADIPWSKQVKSIISISFRTNRRILTWANPHFVKFRNDIWYREPYINVVTDTQRNACGSYFNTLNVSNTAKLKVNRANCYRLLGIDYYG